MRRVLGQWVDPFIGALLAVLAFGLVVPLGDGVLRVLGVVGRGAVALLFLLYGARLSTREVWRGLAHWRLQGGIFTATFVLFPLVGLVLARAVEPWIGSAFAIGVAYVSLLPSTVQSSVAFVSIARGNVAGAICGATVSNVLGMLLTPLLVLGLLHDAAAGGTGAATVGLSRLGDVLLGLLAPFVVGQLVQPWAGGWVRAHRPLTLAVDRGTILVVVLGAVAGATAAGTWAGVSVWDVLALVGVCAVLLGAVLAATWWGGRALGLDVPDRIALLQCGSTKSLATGLPMAGVLLPAAVLGSVVVPVVAFHQLQLVVCSVLARRLALRER
ncbi:bile acid:sodium symporter [Xylanimonas allomyrinae]|uniref:Bile acid:sodium symporter n=1 Tax=Xylanimonas allomyrinae TaxID=2509459 RepID=A0A4P6ELG1_9MICO|nr:bile acid:sodium symporter family protein [Xylanimonas allomyrinae]QAY63462.1 bile acid:sodium symporter [Xylanimonas allomyrinae]